MARILIVDDEVDNLKLLRAILSHTGHTVYPLMRATHIREEIQQIKPDLLILDLLLPGITGGSAYEMIRDTISSTLPIIISSGTKIKLRRRDDSHLRYCPKPVDVNLLIRSVEELLAGTQASPLPAPPEEQAKNDLDRK